MAAKEGFVPLELSGVVESIILLGTHSVERVSIKLNSGDEILAPRRFGTKIETGDAIAVSPRTYSSKLPSRGGVYPEYDDPNARWVRVARGEKIITKFDIPATSINVSQADTHHGAART